MKKIYLAIPYSKVDKELAYKVANIIAAQLIREGNIVFSPITHSHPLVEYGLPNTWEFWEAQDKSFIDWSDEVHIIILGKQGMEYIEQSTGVQGEIEIAKNSNKPIKYIEWKID